MSTLLLCLDQLALARLQLETHEAESGRLAHILTDNAVELMLHHQAECVAKSHGYGLRRRLSREDERELVGQHLEPKLKLSRELGVLTEGEAEFVSINHYYRNEVFHRGLRRNRVIWDLAWHFHGFACELILRLKAGIGTWSHPDKLVPTRLARFGKTQAELTKSEKAVDRIAQEIGHKPVAPTDQLGVVLGRTVESEVKHLDKVLDWMLENMPLSRRRSRIELIVENQLWPAFFEPARRAKCRPHPNAAATAAAMKPDGTDPVEWMRNLLIPPITNDPIQSWLRRARRIATEKNTIQAVKKYHSLRLAMDDLWEDTNSAAAALGNHLDQLRGK